METNKQSGSSKGFVMDIYCNFLVKSVQDTFGVLDSATKKTLKKNFMQTFANAKGDESSITKTFNDMNKTISNLNKKIYTNKDGDRSTKLALNKFIDMLGVDRKEQRKTSNILKKNYLQTAKEAKDKKQYNFRDSALGRTGYYIQQALRGFNIISRSNSEILNSKSLLSRYLRNVNYTDKDGNVITRRELSLEKIMTDFQNATQLLVERFQKLSMYTSELTEKSKKHTKMFDEVYSSVNNQIARDPLAKINKGEALRVAIDIVGAAKFIDKDKDSLLKNADNMYQNAFNRGTFSDGEKVRKMVDVLGIQKFKTSEANYLELMDTLVSGTVEKYDKNGKSYFEAISEKNQNRLREQIKETIFGGDEMALMKAELFHKERYKDNDLYGAVSLNNRNVNISKLNSSLFFSNNERLLKASLSEHFKDLADYEKTIRMPSELKELYDARIKDKEIIGAGEREIIGQLSTIIQNQNNFNKIDNMITKYKIWASSHPVLSTGTSVTGNVAGSLAGSYFATKGIAAAGGGTSLLAGAKGLGASTWAGAKGLGASTWAATKGLGASTWAAAKGLGTTVGSAAAAHPAIATALALLALAGGGYVYYNHKKGDKEENEEININNNQALMHLKNMDKNLEQNNNKLIHNQNPNNYTIIQQNS